MPTSLKYPKCHHVYKGFYFPNDQTKNAAALSEAFAEHGMTVADTQYEMFGMMVTVLTTDGSLYFLDKSHGGGGVFTLEKI